MASLLRRSAAFLAVASIAVLIYNRLSPLGTGHLFTFLLGVLLIPVCKRFISVTPRVNGQTDTSKNYIYGLDHGKLHPKVPTPLWMNLGYWEVCLPKSPATHNAPDMLERKFAESNDGPMAEAVRNLLREVLKTAGHLQRPGS
ncbi:hypothetical protein BDV95DRAFT_583252 [Massariosphaeria phaeospora]|uniref:Uncharacterized protein n=1 Tax=Massariosphaeria phaeospora TaxID=100035 RepID=A0A7C8I783_9PLEO|nr:hypothetical protein BDV95DRAFT_583252 [Massariosphaeria phaeospora]